MTRSLLAFGGVHRLGTWCDRLYVVAYETATVVDTQDINDPTFNHAGVTPRAVVVFIQHPGTTDQITGVTYGGVAMTEMTGSPHVLATGETNVLYGYFLGSSVPSGTQSVVVTTNGTFSFVDGGRAVCISLTAAADTEIVDIDTTINSTSQLNPSVTLSLGGRSSWCAINFGSGTGTVGSITPLTNWTSVAEVDYGAQTGGIYRYNIIGTTDVTAGWTQAADDANAIAVAISEVQAGKASPPPLVRPFFIMTRRVLPRSSAAPQNAAPQKDNSNATCL